MITFRYGALTPDGVRLDGELRATGEREALRLLEARSLTVIEIAPSSRPRPRRGKPKAEDLQLVLMELATLLGAGVPLREAVTALTESATLPSLMDALERASREIDRGMPVSTALSATGLPWPGYVRPLLEAGEASGELGEALQDAADQMAYDRKVAEEITSALVYPAVLVTTGSGAILLMFTMVVPKFAPMLGKVSELPLISKVVIGTGSFLSDNLGVILALAAAAAAALSLWLRRPGNRERAIGMLGRLPLLGAWLVDTDGARWARTLGKGLSRRVPLLDALDLAARGVVLPQVRARLSQVDRKVRRGSPLADALDELQLLPSTGRNLIRVGERSGKLPAMSLALATMLEDAAKRRMKRLLTLLEPAAILVIGLVVGTIILGIILAITSANEVAF